VLPIRDLIKSQRRPVVTWALVAINIVVFFVVQPSSFAGVRTDPTTSEQQSQFLYKNALVPCEASHWHALTPQLTAECQQQPRLFTGGAEFFPGKSVLLSIFASMFFHANLLHLLFNMWFLWIFGDNVEDRFGHVGYLLLYVIGGVIASAAQVASDPNSIVPVIGASGAIAVVMGSYLVLYPRARVITIILTIFFLPLLLPAVLLLGFWFVSQFFTETSSGVAWVAHVGGFVAGAVVTWLIFHGRTRQPDPAPNY